ISDFLASEKPYAVANTSGLPEEAFRQAFPTVEAATVLAPDASGVADLLQSVRDPQLDKLAAARAELKQRLLGPAEPTSQERFDAAGRSLCAAAAAHRSRTAPRLAAELPGQRGQSPTEAETRACVPATCRVAPGAGGGRPSRAGGRPPAREGLRPPRGGPAGPMAQPVSGLGHGVPLGPEGPAGDPRRPSRGPAQAQPGPQA